MEITNNSFFSDSTGKVTFSGFQLKRGPEGMYGFKAELVYEGMISPPQSDTFYANFKSSVAEI